VARGVYSYRVQARIVLVGAPRFIHIAFGGRVLLIGEQFLIARFTSIAFGGSIVLIGALLNHADIHLKIQKISFNFRIRGACRRPAT
jgi:hypothetical protein